MEESNERKRRRKDSSEELSTPKKKDLPKYGSQEYWSARYDKDIQQEEAPEAFHSWYFNYSELSPILLPLILGEEANEEGDGEDEEHDEQYDNGNGESEQGIMGNGSVGKKSLNDESSNNDSGNENQNAREDEEESEEQELEDDEFVEFEEMDGDGEEQAPKRVGLAKEGAIAVLEVGCGDMPLGSDLAKGIKQLESATGVNAKNILKKVVCIDYAKNVIDAMKEEQRNEQVGASESQSVPVIFEYGDARNLSYPDSSFQLILEKGTMDAMLSDTSMGTENCRLIVSECGRLLSSGGCLLIVSHLNAHVQAGLEWLDSIVVPGLRMSGGQHDEWEIEVHGNAPSPQDEKDDREEDEPESPGPAVYIISKVKPVSPGMATPKGTKTEDDPPNIPLKFFTY